MADAWMLLRFNPGELGYMDILSEDSYEPVIICKTREELVEFLGTENTTWNGDTATFTKYNWKGNIKYEETLYAIPITFGKIIVY